MIITKEKTVAFTGNRTLTTAAGRPDANLENVIRTELSYCLEDCYQEGKNIFISGMAIGWDMLCAEEVLKLKDRHSDVILIAAIPFQGQELLYNDHDKQRYKTIYEAADRIEIITNGGYDNAAYHKRNDWMIANCSEIIAYESGKPRSGTSSTIRKALQEGLEVFNIFDELHSYFTSNHPAKSSLQNYPDISSLRYGRDGVIFRGVKLPLSIAFEQIARIEKNEAYLCFFLNDQQKIFASLTLDEYQVVSASRIGD